MSLEVIYDSSRLCLIHTLYIELRIKQVIAIKIVDDFDSEKQAMEGLYFTVR